MEIFTTWLMFTIGIYTSLMATLLEPSNFISRIVFTFIPFLISLSSLFVWAVRMGFLGG